MVDANKYRAADFKHAGWDKDTVFSDGHSNILPATLRALDFVAGKAREIEHEAICHPHQIAIFEAQKWLIVEETLRAVLACSDVESSAYRHKGNDGATLIDHIEDAMALIKHSSSTQEDCQ